MGRCVKPVYSTASLTGLDERPVDVTAALLCPALPYPESFSLLNYFLLFTGRTSCFE